MNVDIEYTNNVLLQLMNRYKYPELNANCFVVQGSSGELFVTARAPEALELWAKTNGFSSFDGFFAEFHDQMKYDSEGNVFLDEGGSVKRAKIEGYYRDGVYNL